MPLLARLYWPGVRVLTQNRYSDSIWDTGHKKHKIHKIVYEFCASTKRKGDSAQPQVLWLFLQPVCEVLPQFFNLRLSNINDIRLVGVTCSVVLVVILGNIERL